MSEPGKPFSRRDFLSATTGAGAAWAFTQMIPGAAVAATAPRDSRISQTPLADKGFASIRKIGNGVYATVSNPAKGFDTLCNGGFLVGRDSALCIEGFATPAGASFQMDALRQVNKAPVQAALDTHYHFDHTMGNSFYGGLSIPVWAHFRTASRMGQTFGSIQNNSKEAFLGRFEKAVTAAKTEQERQRAQGDLDAATGMYNTICASLVAFPNHSVQQNNSPSMTFDLGGLSAVVEPLSGHSGTDVIVRIPDQHIVFTGDLLYSSWYPVTFDANISLWRETLKTFAGYEKDTIFVPGHGGICGQEGIALAQAVFDDIAEQSYNLFAGGATPEEAIQRYVVPERFKDFYIFSWGLTIGSAINKLHFDWMSKQAADKASKAPAQSPKPPASVPISPQPSLVPH
jgi:glyoxylase-like metal-dependent hydrolase (beta-lactamase superfamily II)